MKENTIFAEVVPSHHSSLARSALMGILPKIKGNLIQKDDKIFLERKVPSFLGKQLGYTPDLP